MYEPHLITLRGQVQSDEEVDIEAVRLETNPQGIGFHTSEFENRLKPGQVDGLEDRFTPSDRSEFDPQRVQRQSATFALRQQALNVQRISDEPLGHAVPERRHFPRMHIEPLEQSPLSMEVRPGGDQNDGSPGRMLLQMPRQFQQGSDTARRLRGRVLGGDNRDPIVVGLNGDNLVGQFRILTRNRPPQIPGGVALIVHPRRHSNTQRLVAETFLERQCRLSGKPEAGHIDRGPAPLVASLPHRRGLRCDEDDGSRPEGGGILPVLPGIELHENDVVLNLETIEVFVLTFAAVEQIPRQSLRTGGVRTHEIGPQGQQRDRLDHLAVGVEQFKGGSLVHGDGDLVRLTHDPFDACRIEFTLDVVGGVSIPRITRHP